MYIIVFMLSLIVPFSSTLKNEEFFDTSTTDDNQLIDYGIGKDAFPLYHYKPQKPIPENCLEIMKKGNSSGIYWIKPRNSKPFRVLCDMETWGGGWAHVQKRYDGSQDFYYGWRDYKHGFGYLNREHWIGLEQIRALTEYKTAELLVELTDQNGTVAHAHYDYFQIGSEQQAYQLTLLSGFKGDTGDSLDYHRGMNFSTYDLNLNINSDVNCAIHCKYKTAELLVELTDQNLTVAHAHYYYFQIGSEQQAYQLTLLSGFKGDAGDSLDYHRGMNFSTYDLNMGAWWYNTCTRSNLNGKFMNVHLIDKYICQALQWTTFRTESWLHPHAASRMLVRPSKEESNRIQ